MGQNIDEVKKGCFTLVMRDLWDRHCTGKALAVAEILMYGTYAGIQLGLIAEPTEGGDSVFADFSAVDANEGDTYFGPEVKQNQAAQCPVFSHCDKSMLVEYQSPLGW